MSGHVFPYLLLIDKITANRMSAVTSLIHRSWLSAITRLKCLKWQLTKSHNSRSSVCSPGSCEVALIIHSFSCQRLAASECRRLHGSSFPESSGLPLGFALKRCEVKHRWLEKTQTRNCQKRKVLGKSVAEILSYLQVIYGVRYFRHYTDSLKYMQ